MFISHQKYIKIQSKYPNFTEKAKKNKKLKLSF